MKKLLSLILSLLLLTMTVVSVSAAGDTIEPIFGSDHGFGLLSSEPDLEIGAVDSESPKLNEPAYRTNLQSAGEDLRTAMKNRQATAEIGLRTTSVSEEDLEYWAYEILAWAVAHTGVGDEGDYLAWVCAVDSVSVDGYTEGSYAYLTYTYTLTYATSASQEQKVADRIDTLLDQLDIREADSYTALVTLYDYICTNITYTGIPTESAPADDFVAYGALINGKANSYGFSHLFYRLALELGLDCRMIGGVVGEDEVFWNIVLMDMYYYNVDAALDAGKDEYQYFLRSDESFADHLRYEEFATEEYYDHYPMDPLDYEGYEVAVDGGSCGENVEWVIGHRGTLIIQGTGPMDDYTKEGMGYQESSSVPWYAYKDAIRVIVVDEGVTSIGRGSTGICSNLEAVAIAGSVEKIPEYAFQNCAVLTTVVLSEGLTAIERDAFTSCQMLTELMLPSTLESIGEQAFYMSNLRSITIPAAVHTIGKNCFLSCGELAEILVEAGSPYFASYDGVLYTADMTHLVVCPDGKQGDVTIPDSVVSMEEYAVGHTNGVEDVVIGNGLKIIPEGAFYYSRLSGITIGTGVEKIQLAAFKSCQNLTTIRFLGSAPIIENRAFDVSGATAYYPAGDPTWTQEAMDQAGSGITWVSYCSDHQGVLTGAVEASCTQDGYTGDQVCSLCGEVFSKGSIIPATGHNYVNEICTICGRGEVIRLSGSSRVSTAIAVAEKLKEVLGRESFDTIIIANGNNFADALTGSYLATVREAPILLYRSNEIALNEEYIRNNLSKNGIVYILGGTAAVPADVEESLKAQGYHVERLFGNSRYDTNLKILEAAGVTNEEILICTGWEYADSLSASAAGLPILMVNTSTNQLLDSQIEFLKAHSGNSFTIIGGSAAVSEELEADVEAVVGNVSRVYGNSREATSVKVAERYFEAPDRVLIAYSRNFPDGLCGGPLAYAMNAPLLLVNAGKEAPAAEYVAESEITKGVVLGGTVAVSDKSVEVIFENEM